MPRHDAKRRLDCEGRWATPGLVDCHTHLVFGGDRAAEFEQRLAGATYEEWPALAAASPPPSAPPAWRAKTRWWLPPCPASTGLLAEGATTSR
jgi:imidazolonepropionase